MTERTAYLLDTNVISELHKSKPSAAVLAFVKAARTTSLFTSVLVMGELRWGAAIRERTDAVGARRLASWIDDVEESFEDRILPVDVETAGLWGRLSADRTRSVVDTLLAATAERHRLTVVSRNTRDFKGLPVTLLNPWTQR